jgi:hypothetical protein
MEFQVDPERTWIFDVASTTRLHFFDRSRLNRPELFMKGEDMTDPENGVPDQPSPHAAPLRAASRALPQIRLVPAHPKLLVSSSTQEPADLFDPFPLPPLPISLSNQCAVMAETFYQQHQRCVGFVLLLDCRDRSWGIGIPRQRCSADSACWDTSREDFPNLPPQSVVAGSFQSRIIHTASELPEVPPPHDGMHLVQRFEPDQWSIASFIRIGNRCNQVSFDQIIIDDWNSLIHQHASRLTIV